MSKETNAKFNREGASNLKSQDTNEKLDTYEGEIRTRKSLSDQLRENSKKKLQDFQKLTQEKNSFTRLSKDDIQHLDSIKAKELKILKELEEVSALATRKTTINNIDTDIPRKITVPTKLSLRKPRKEKSKAWGIVHKKYPEK